MTTPVPHIPTNLPAEERARLAEEAGVTLAAIGLARAADGTIIPAPAETAPAPAELVATPSQAFDPEADAKSQAAFLDALSADLAGGFASDADLIAAAQATHGPDARQAELDAQRAAHAAEIAGVASPLIVVPPSRPPCSQHDLVATATALLAPLVGGSYATATDSTGERVTGGLLAIDDHMIGFALDIAAKLHTEAKKLVG